MNIEYFKVIYHYCDNTLQFSDINSLTSVDDISDIQGYYRDKILFIGFIKDHSIRNILDQLKENRNYFDDGSEEDMLLKQYFGLKYKNNWGVIDASEYSNIHFIEDVISKNDTVYKIKRILSTYLSKIYEISFSPEVQSLWGTFLETPLLVNKWNNFCHKFHDLFVPIDINILKMYIITKNYVTYKNDPTFLEKCQKSITESEHLHKSIELKKLYMSTEQNKLLGHTFQYKHFSVFNEPNIILNMVIDDRFITGNTDSIRDLKLETKESSNTIYHFGKLKRNEIHIQNILNIHHYIQNDPVLKTKIVLHQTTQKQKYIQGFIRRYCPSILDYDMLSKLYSTPYLETIQLYETSTLYHNRLKSMYQYILQENSIDISDISKSIQVDHYPIHFNFGGIYQLFFQIPLQNNYNILDVNHNVLFNNIQLSKNIPFMSIWNPDNKQYYYKIYKQSVEKTYQNEYPTITSDILINWLENNKKTMHGLKIAYEKNISKHILLKAYIDTSIDKTERHFVEIISYDHKYIDVKYLENNMIQYGLIHKCMVNPSDELIEGNHIYIYKHFDIYADLIINNEGCMDVSIDYLLPNVLEIDNLNTVFKQLQTHIKYINSIPNIFNSIKQEYITPSSKLVIDYIIPYYNYTFEVKHISYYMNVEIANHNLISYDLFLHFIKCFYPFYSVMDIIYQEGQNIEINIEGQWKDGFIDKANIKKNSIQYDVQYYPTRGVSKTLIKKNVFNIQLRKKTDRLTREYIHLKYKLIDHFELSSPINTLIQKYQITNHDSQFIILELMKQFDLDAVTAKDKYNIYKEKKKRYKNIGNSIDIKIYLNKIDKTELGYSIPILVENAYEFTQLHIIKKEIVSLFILYQDIIIKNQSEKYNSLFSFTIENCDVEKKTKQLDDEIDELDDLMNDFDVSDSDSVLSTDSDEEIDNQSGKVIDVVSDALDKLNDRVDQDRLDTELDLLVASSEATIDSNNIFLKKMYTKDPYLFWKTSKQSTDMEKKGDKVYTKICQGGRHPMIITDDQKKRIDKDFPNSYNLELPQKNCTDNASCSKETHHINKKKCCSAIYHGSTDEKRVWYICPRIWCIHDEISLHPNNLVMTTPLIVNKKIVCNQFVSDWNSSDNWRICKTCGNDIRIHPLKCPICNRGIIKRKNNITEEESIYISDNNFQYPGFLESSKHPDGLYAPCCFKNPNKRVNEAFGYGKEKLVSQSNQYIQNWNKDLGWNPPRLGVLPKILYSLFNMDISVCIAQHMSDTKKCYLRQGIYQSCNSIIEAIGNTLPSKYFRSSDSYNHNNIRANYLIELIVQNITKVEFHSLYSGLLDRLFLDNHNTITSYQNFLEHMLSDEEKDYRLMMNIFTSSFSWLPIEFRNGLNIILIEITKNENQEEIASIVCPTLFKMNSIDDPNTNTIIIIKNKKIFEPVYYYEGSIDTVIRIFTGKDNSTVQKCIEYIRDKYKIHETNILNSFITEYDSTQEYEKINSYIISHYSKSYFVESQIINTYHKTIGFMYTNLHNRIYVPCKPMTSIKHIIRESILHLDVDKLSPYHVYLDFYKKIESHLGYTLSKKIVSLNKIIGFLTDDNQFIPVKPTAQSELINLPEENLDYIGIEKAIDSFKKTKKIEFTPKQNINTVISLLDRMNKKNEIIHPSTNLYKIKYKLVTPDNFIYGLMTNDMLFIPIQNIADSSAIKYPVIQKDRIPKLNTKTLIDKYIKLFKDSVMQLKIRPMRIIVDDDKNISKLILETNDMVDVLEGDSLLTKDSSGTYLIHLMNSIEYNFIPEEIINNSYERLHSDERVQTIQQITYETEFYLRYKFEIANYLRFNRKIKQDIKKIINNIISTVNQKRIQLRNHIESISNKIISNKSDKDIMDFDLSYIPTIQCGTLHKNKDTCNTHPYCTWVTNVPSVGIRKVPDPFKIFKTEHIDKLSTTYTSETIKKKLTELNIKSSSRTSKNIQLLLLHMWRNLDKQTKDYYKNKVLETIELNKKKIPPTGSNQCKLYLHKYKSNGLDYFIRKIIEELIHNNIVYNEIIHNKVIIDTGHLKYKKNQEEILLNSDQLNRTVINNLYKIHQKMYNKNMNMYEYPSEIIDQSMEKTEIKIPITCTLNPIKFNTRFKMIGKKKIIFQDINGLHHMIEEKYTKLMEHFNKINITLDKKQVKKTIHAVPFRLLLGKQILQL